MRSPFGNARKLVAQTLWIVDRAVPKIPDIIRDTPHLRILAHLINFLDRGGARRQAQHHRSTRLCESETQHPNVVSPVGMTADAIGLDQIDAPTCIESSNRIVVCLGRWLACVCSKVIRIPGTKIFCVGSLSSVVGRVFDGQIFLDRLLRNSTKNVNSKLQTKPMHEIGERLETGSFSRGGKPIRGRNVSPLIVETELRF